MSITSTWEMGRLTATKKSSSTARKRISSGSQERQAKCHGACESHQPYVYEVPMLGFTLEVMVPASIPEVSWRKFMESLSAKARRLGRKYLRAEEWNPESYIDPLYRTSIQYRSRTVSSSAWSDV